MCSNCSFYRLLLLIILLYSCKKKDSSNNNPTPTYTPAVTPIGTPIGNPVSKTIGSGGGSLASSDGKIDLNIPAGALSSNTNISIQTVTNEAPGGIGLSYHLMPDGTKFTKPVTLTFHYTDQDINGTLPYLLYIAYQDSALQWKADFKKRNVDTISKTVSLGISHFSIWSMGDRLNMFTRPDELHQNETSQITIEHIDVPSQPGSGPDDLPSLPISSRLSDNAVSNWKVNGQLNGNSQNGTISGSGSSVSYKAPASIPNNRTVQVSAELKYSIVIYNNGNAVSSVDKLILFGNISLLPDNFSYHLLLEFKLNFSNSIQTVLYTDTADLDITIEHDIVTISNIINKAPTIKPTSYTIGACTVTYLLGSYGEMNIIGGDGYTGTGPSNEKVFGLLLKEDNLHGVGSSTSCTGVPPIDVPPPVIQHDAPGAQFDLKKQQQTVVQTVGQGTITYTLTPK